MANILNDISDNQARAMLDLERKSLERKRESLVKLIEEHQRAIDKLDARLREVDQGERVLSRHGN